MRDTSSTTSLLAPSPAPRSSFLSDDFTAIAPYSDPKFARPYSYYLSKATPSTNARSSNVPSEPPPQSQRATADRMFVRAPAAPPSHSVDVPDAALSATGTEWSVRYTELTRQIQELETTIRDLNYPVAVDAPLPSQSVEARRLARKNRRARIAALKEEIARLRLELEKEYRLMMEVVPRRGQPREKMLTVVE
ncbi:hypothetical protein OH77DRAFT_1481525, partial [Trametes cingulata]